MKIIPEPFPLRFKTQEAAERFRQSYLDRKPDAREAVPPFIKQDGVSRCNPEYEEAQFEWTLIEA